MIFPIGLSGFGKIAIPCGVGRLRGFFEALGRAIHFPKGGIIKGVNLSTGVMGTILILGGCASKWVTITTAPGGGRW